MTDKTENELIAEFMGLRLGAENQYYFSEESSGIGFIGLKLPNELKYSSSWDWLMPVVEKIETMPIGGFPSEFCIKWNRCDLLVNVDPKELRTNFGVVADSRIKAVYQTVVSYIRWYNESKDKTETR